ncbi:hypothetical protein F8388_011183 [Cannabis sativa]|uniref:Copine C-terminal domain-containing protein n=1 Tax=Cannabis sativa TaxID=3483 RepID=A0A7J6EG79_CANSA|nr:hypothetical protein F8388_011183 [Cannabis sativa]
MVALESVAAVARLQRWQHLWNRGEYPLSIILVGVDDVPWVLMQKFDDFVTSRAFDNCQCTLNLIMMITHEFTTIMVKDIPISYNETEFFVEALIEIPSQYKCGICANCNWNDRCGHCKKLAPEYEKLGASFKWIVTSTRAFAISIVILHIPILSGFQKGHSNPKIKKIDHNVRIIVESLDPPPPMHAHSSDKGPFSSHFVLARDN